MRGVGATVNSTPLLFIPVTCTTTFPVVAVAGTCTTTPLALQLNGLAVVPLKVTVLDPCVAPRLVPAIVTVVPTGPAVGFRLVMVSGTTMNKTPLLAVPLTVTTTFPVVAAGGTVVTMLVEVQHVPQTDA
jgi:hypothetical protein